MTMKKLILLTKLLLISNLLFGQINNTNVYWVGHSLISHTDNYAPGTMNLIGLMEILVTS